MEQTLDGGGAWSGWPLSDVCRQKISLESVQLFQAENHQRRLTGLGGGFPVFYGSCHLHGLMAGGNKTDQDNTVCYLPDCRAREQP